MEVERLWIYQTLPVVPGCCFLGGRAMRAGVGEMRPRLRLRVRGCNTGQEGPQQGAEVPQVSWSF